MKEKENYLRGLSLESQTASEVKRLLRGTIVEETITPHDVDWEHLHEKARGQ